MRKVRRQVEAAGTQVAFVHQGTEEEAAPLFQKYGMDDVPRVSDPQAKLYEAFGIRRGTMLQYAGPKAIWRGAWAALIRRHGFGRIIGDHARMAGVFVVHRGRLLRAFRHRTSADRPDYVGLATGRTK